MVLSLPSLSSLLKFPNNYNKAFVTVFKSPKCLRTIGHFTVVYSVTRPTNGSESAGDLVLIQTSLFFYHVNRVVVMLKPGLHVRRKHKHKHKHKHKKPTCKPVRRKHKRLVLALVFMLASSRFTRTTQRRKHKHKHKRMERFPFSCASAYACVVASYV